MRDKTLLGGIIVMGVGAILIGVVWFLFLQPSRIPTEPLVAIPVEIDSDAGEFTLFEIDAAQSELIFNLDEELRGLPTVVIGNSRQVAGQIAVDFENPPASKIGPILINARTFLTENEFRDNAIHSFILDTDAYEYITFMPTKLSGIPEIFEADKPISITIEGELTIRDITQSVIFSGTVTVKGRSQLSGSASAHINRSDFQLQIPDAPGVAKVSEEVSLIIHFVALPVQ